MEWDVAFATLSSALSTLAVLGTLGAGAVRLRSLRKQERTLSQASFESAARTSKLEDLGQLLERELGSVLLDEYSRNPDLRTQFKTTFDKIAEFVGSAELQEQEGVARSSPDTWRSEAGQFKTESGDPEMERALASVLHGEVWNGLARARRRLESELSEIAHQNGASVGEHKRGAGQLLGLVSGMGAVDSSTARGLQFALQVANSGIHGSEVEAGNALESIELIDRFIGQNQRKSSG